VGLADAPARSSEEENCDGSKVDFSWRWFATIINRWRGHGYRRAEQGPVFIAGDQPVTEDQVRQKLQSDGWSNVQIVRDGQYFEAIGSKDGQTTKVAVDTQTGRLRAADEDDDD
jgi:hypothetical protein